MGRLMANNFFYFSENHILTACANMFVYPRGLGLVATKSQSASGNAFETVKIMRRKSKQAP